MMFHKHRYYLSIDTTRLPLTKHTVTRVFRTCRCGDCQRILRIETPESAVINDINPRANGVVWQDVTP